MAGKSPAKHLLPHVKGEGLMISKDEAFLILSKWQDEGTAVRFIASQSELGVSVKGRVRFDRGYIKVENAEDTVAFPEEAGAVFEYTDSRDVKVPSFVGQEWRNALGIVLPSGWKFFLVAEGN